MVDAYYFIVGAQAVVVSTSSLKYKIKAKGAYSSVLIKPWILSTTIVSWSTGFNEDSDTSNMMDQYGPCRACLFGLDLPFANCKVGSMTSSVGVL